MEMDLTATNLRAELAKSQRHQWSLFDQAVQDAADAGSDGRTAPNVFETTLPDDPGFGTALEMLENAEDDAEIYVALTEIQRVASEWAGLADETSDVYRDAFGG